jgi:hypothetical protein
MQKAKFICDQCEVEGTVRLGDDFDDYPIAFCPSCGAPLDNDDDDLDED